jgi:hypothetical protein
MSLLESHLSSQSLRSTHNSLILSLQCSGHLLRRKNKLVKHSLALQKCRLEHLLRDLRSLESRDTLLHQFKVVMMAHPCHLYHTNVLDNHHSCHKEMALDLHSPSATLVLHLYRIRSSKIIDRLQVPL